MEAAIETEKSVLEENQSKWKCVICLDLLINPVYCTKSCGKTTVLCEECMEKTLQNTGHKCPICKNRLQGWNRRRKSFYCQQLWRDIRTRLPELCRRRARGDNVMDSIAEDSSAIARRACSLAKEGEIAKELQEKQAKQDAQREESNRENEALFQAYLDSNQEYEPPQPKHNQQDEVLARRLQAVEDEQCRNLKREQESRESRDAAMARKLQHELDNEQTPRPLKGSSRSVRKRKLVDLSKGGASKRWKPKTKGAISNWLLSPHNASTP